MERFDFAFYEYQLQVLKSDTLIQKIPIKEYDNILKVAKYISDKLIEKYKKIIVNDGLLDYLKKNGITLEEKDCKTGNCEGRTVYGEFFEKEKQIVLYTETINSNFLTFTNNTKKFVELHECFHCLEKNEKINYRDYYTVSLFKIGKWSWNSSIRALSELSANQFAYMIQNILKAGKVNEKNF